MLFALHRALNFFRGPSFRGNGEASA